MPRRFVDLSIAIQNDYVADPPGLEPKIVYTDHKESAPIVAKRYGIQPEELVYGEGFGVERLTLTTHNGTHIDAPWHYA